MMLSKIIWNADPVLLKLGSLVLTWYATAYIVSFIAHYYLMRYFFAKDGKSQDHAMRITETLFICGLLGSRLGQVFFYEWPYYSHHLTEIPQLWKGGMSSHGSALGVLAGIYYYARKNNWPLLYLTDRVAISSLVGAGLIRIGNLFNSEIYGKPTEVPWAFRFERIDNEWRHPSQLYDVIISGSLCIFLMWLYRREKNQPDGKITGLFFVLGFGVRVLVESYKADAELTRWLSLPFIMMGVYLLGRPARSFLK